MLSDCNRASAALGTSLRSWGLALLQTSQADFTEELRTI